MGSTHIFGRFKGNISGEQTTTLTIEYTGKIEGEINGIHVIIHGQFLGEITEAESVEVLSTGRVKGNISSKSVKIFPGAKVDGQINSIKNSSKT